MNAEIGVRSPLVTCPPSEANVCSSFYFSSTRSANVNFFETSPDNKTHNPPMHCADMVWMCFVVRALCPVRFGTILTSDPSRFGRKSAQLKFEPCMAFRKTMTPPPLFGSPNFCPGPPPPPKSGSESRSTAAAANSKPVQKTETKKVTHVRMRCLMGRGSVTETQARRRTRSTRGRVRRGRGARRRDAEFKLDPVGSVRWRCVASDASPTRRRAFCSSVNVPETFRAALRPSKR